MILSVSRRTDVPAFYSEWFYRRMQQGFVHVRNPFNPKQVSRIELNRENIDCIVFWSKDPRPLIKELDQIKDYQYYFQFTITPYGKDIESNIVDKHEIVQAFAELSERIGKDRVILRYDPILLTDRYSIDFHKRSFAKLMQVLGNHTERVVVSFLDQYAKTKRNMKKIKLTELTDGDMHELGKFMVESAGVHKVTVETCAEAMDLSGIGIQHGKCIDADLIERLCNKTALSMESSNERNKLKLPGKDKNRENCLCDKSIDIGQYDTCIHGCSYCYANASKSRSEQNFNNHVASATILAGTIDECKVSAKKPQYTSLELTDHAKQLKI